MHRQILEKNSQINLSNFKRSSYLSSFLHDLVKLELYHKYSIVWHYDRCNKYIYYIYKCYKFIIYYKFVINL